MHHGICAHRHARAVDGPLRWLALGLITLLAAAGGGGCSGSESGGVPRGVTLTEAERIPPGLPLGPVTLSYEVDCPATEVIVGFQIWRDGAFIQALRPLCSTLKVTLEDDGTYVIATEEDPTRIPDPEPPIPSDPADFDLPGVTSQIVGAIVRSFRPRAADTLLECAFNAVVVGRGQTRSPEGMTSFWMECAQMQIDGDAVVAGKIDTSPPVPLGEAPPPLETDRCANGEVFVAVDGEAFVDYTLDNTVPIADALVSRIQTVGAQCAAVGLTF
jgi:hypothetical protein